MEEVLDKEGERRIMARYYVEPLLNIIVNWDFKKLLHRLFVLCKVCRIALDVKKNPLVSQADRDGGQREPNWQTGRAERQQQQQTQKRVQRTAAPKLLLAPLAHGKSQNFYRGKSLEKCAAPRRLQLRWNPLQFSQ